MMNERLDRAACPSADVLARIASGEGDAAERTRVVDHLGICRACTEEYRVAAALGLWARKTASELAPSTSDTRGESAARTRGTAYLAVAASLIAAAAALTWALALRAQNGQLAADLQAARSLAEQHLQPAATSTTSATAAIEQRAKEIEDLRARLESAQQPAVNVAIVDLEPPDLLRGPERRQPVPVPASAPLVTFVLSVARAPGAGPHDLEIAGPSGNIVWRGGGLRATAEKTFVVAVPRSLLPAGTSRFRLYASQTARRVLVQEYAVRVIP